MIFKIAPSPLYGFEPILPFDLSNGVVGRRKPLTGEQKDKRKNARKLAFKMRKLNRRK